MQNSIRTGEVLFEVALNSYSLLLQHMSSYLEFNSDLQSLLLDRLELHPESGSTKPELIFMDTIDEISPELLSVKNEQSIVIKTKDSRLVITNSVSQGFCS